jgi:hypothetical protein
MSDGTKSKIWRGFVEYVNAPNLESSPSALDNLAQTLSECMPWMARTAFDEDVPAMIAFRINREVLFRQLDEKQISQGLKSLDADDPLMIALGINREDFFRQLDGKKIWGSFRIEEYLASEFLRQAIEYQPQVRQLLTWLSDRNKNEKDRPHAFAFLREHMKHIEFQHGDPAFAPDEEQGRYFTMRGDLKDDFPERTLSYKDLADVICDFVQREHELRREAAIRICKRPACGNLVAQFKKRKYCRTADCDRERQKRDDDLKKRKNRDNVFLCRFRKLPLAMRRKKAKEAAKRLREIENYWRDKNQSLAKHALELLNKG